MNEQTQTGGLNNEITESRVNDVSRLITNHSCISYSSGVSMSKLTGTEQIFRALLKTKTKFYHLNCNGLRVTDHPMTLQEIGVKFGSVDKIEKMAEFKFIEVKESA